MAKTPSGKYWVTWANVHARNSHSVEELVDPFKSHVKAFIKALQEHDAHVEIRSTRRDPQRAYLFHWCWMIALGKCKPPDATAYPGIEIEWDHGDLAKSKAAAQEMVRGFGLAIPPQSTVAPSLTSNHIAGKAIDMEISWTDTLHVPRKDGKIMSVPYMVNPNINMALIELGESYGVKKHRHDAPHWSVDGR